MNRLSDDNRYYLIGKDKKYPRLSTVMEAQGNKGLDAWKKRVGEEQAKAIAQETSAWGTAVHLVTALSDLKKWRKMEAMIKADESLLPPLLVWQNYIIDYVRKIIAIEVVSWSDQLRVAGTIDRIAIIKGDSFPSILDIKTGSLYDEIGIKLAGYQIMWNEMNPLTRTRQVTRRLAIQLPRVNPGTVKAKEYTDGKYTMKFVEAVEQYYALTT